MNVSLVFATLLCLTVWKSCVHATHTPLVNCCMILYNTKIPLTRIANYTLQFEGVCPIAAIRFGTIRGKIICSDPNDGWAKRAKAKVDKDEENRKKALQAHGQTKEGSTNGVTPAAKVTPAAEATPAAEVVTAAEATPAAEVSPAAEVTPAAEVASAAEVSPAAEATPAAEVASAAEATPAAEVSPAAKVASAAEATPAAEVSPAAEVASAAEATPAAEVASAAEATPAAEVSPAAEATMSKKATMPKKAPQRGGWRRRRLLGRRSRKWRKRQLRRRG
ncbi:uncharacterized protein AB9X84_002026 [Acanthopagrus schlegelii]